MMRMFYSVSWSRALKLGALAGLLTVGGSACQELPPPEAPKAATARQAPRRLVTNELNIVRTSDGQEAVSGELLVRFKAGQEGSLRTHGLMGAQVVRTYPSISGLQRISLPRGMDLEQAVEAYRADPDVLYAEPNYIYHADVIPEDPEFDDLWGMHNTGQSGGKADVDLNMPEAWELSTGSDDTVIAIIDTGINYLHEDLADNMWVNPGEIPDNDVDDDGNGYVDDVHGINAINGSGDPLDDNRHGSHCAGTIAGRGDNGKGVTGVNWRAKLIACKFLNAAGSGATADAVECLDYLHGLHTRSSNPVHIVASNNSWGGGTASAALQDAITRHLQAGILFIAAAGNNSANNDTTNNYPSNYPVPNIVAVAAIDRNDAVASFSNYGRRRVHVGAPGVDILSSVLGQDYALLSGTSMATPHVSGLVGLLKTQEPSRDWRQLKNLLMAGGLDTPALAGKTISGRRVRAADVGGRGSLTCDNQVLTRKLTPAADSLQVLRGGAVDISAIHINCANPAGPLELTVSPGGGTVSLADDGQDMDLVEGDGLFVTQWRPPGAGTYTLTFPSGETITVTAMDTYRPAQTVPFEWRTITGTPLNLADNTVLQVPTPFPVRYGNHVGFTQAWVASEGYLSFTDTRYTATNARLPSTNWTTLVAPFWDSLHTLTTPPGNVYQEVLGTAPHREWVIEWRNIGSSSRTSDTPYPTITFQVVFKEASSEVVFNYMDVDFRTGTDTYDRGGSATVGVQVIPTDATLFSYNAKNLFTNMSLVFRTNAPPVVNELTAVQASVVEGGTLDFTASFADADGAADADWTAEIDFDYVGTTFTVDSTQTFTAEGPITASRTYPQSGRFIVGMRVKDRDGGTSAIRTLVVNVDNASPVALLPTATPASTHEGLNVRLAATFSDVGVSDNPWKVEWDMDYDGTEFKPDRTQSINLQGPITLDHVFRRDGTF
ncbi:MAG TPA: S8 family peptidase, partial [Myxococcaceae bacterium]